MGVININGIDLELDLLDADVMEKFENLCKKIGEKIEERTQYEGLSTAEAMRKQCRYVDRFFDDLFGEGTAKACFNGSNNLGDRMRAFGKVVSEKGNYGDEIGAIYDQYSSDRIRNREQRRQLGHKRKKPRNPVRRAR